MRERGSATAEVAIVLPGVVLLLALLLAAGSGAVAHIRCVDAARTGARLAARGESAAAVVAAARAAAPGGATVTVSSGNGTVTVRVGARVALPLAGAGGLQVHADATAALEPELAP